MTPKLSNFCIICSNLKSNFFEFFLYFATITTHTIINDTVSIMIATSTITVTKRTTFPLPLLPGVDTKVNTVKLS